jgi:beta-glucosidase
MKRPAVLCAALVAALVSTALATPAHADTPPWMNTAQTPLDRANELLAAMTLTEKLAMMHSAAACNGYDTCVAGNTRLGIPDLRMMDGPDGVGDGAIGVTQLAAPVAAAATWDTALEGQYGQVIGSEMWGKGVNVVLGPTINIDRDPRWGRSWESFSEDPYLSARMAVADIQGIQSQGPIAEVKHYAVYNQETFRNNPQDNAIVSDRVQREIYLQAFEAAIKQGKANSAMCSYAEINGVFACENAQLQQNILKNEWGFTGFIGSDFGATHSTVASVNNGLDVELPDSTYFGQPLTDAVTNGQVSTTTIDNAVRRILVAMFTAGLFDKAQPGTLNTVVTNAANAGVSKQVATEGSVLLKNTGVLPIGASTHSIAVIGDDAGQDAMSVGGGSASVNAPYLVTPYQGISARAGSGATVTFAQGVANPNGGPLDPSVLTPSSGTGHGLFGQFYNGNALGGAVLASRVDPSLSFIWGGASPVSGVPATNWSAKWTGTLTPPTTGTYQFALNSDDGSRLIINGQTVVNNWFDQPATTRTGSIALTAGQPVSIEVDYFQDGGGSQLGLTWQIPNQDLHGQAVAAAQAANTAIVFVDNLEGEGADLSTIDLSAAQNQLVTDVAAVNPNTIVVVNSGSAVTMPWLSSVKAVVENWYPGQEDGNAIAFLLYGDQNFSGKLPVTFPQSLADVPAHTTAQWPGQNSQVQYSEGLQVGYRWYDAQNKTPLFPFGFGLSYTSFGYANLTVGTPDASGNVAVGFDVTNTGTRAGAEVAQVYVGQPATSGEPPRNLRGFQRVSLNPGQTSHVSLSLAARSFQTWTTAWTNTAGSHSVYVGSSSRDIRLTGHVTIGGSTPVSPAISLRAHANNNYVTADNAGASPLIANRTSIGPWETFDEIDLGNGNIGLRAHANNNYVTAENAGAAPLIANRTAIGGWETFGLIHNGDGSISLKAVNGDYVTAENAGAAALIANRTAIGGWEEFDLIS